MTDTGRRARKKKILLLRAMQNEIYSSLLLHKQSKLYIL